MSAGRDWRRRAYAAARRIPQGDENEDWESTDVRKDDYRAAGYATYSFR